MTSSTPDQASWPKGIFHLRRVFDARNSPINNTTEAKCQLTMATLFGKQKGKNHVTLTCSVSKPGGFIRPRHAFIRAKQDKTGTTIMSYEICPFPGAQVYVNRQLIARFTRLCANDLVTFGNGLNYNHACYHFKFEPADPCLPYPSVLSNSRALSVRAMRSLNLVEGTFDTKVGEELCFYRGEESLLVSNLMRRSSHSKSDQSRGPGDENVAPISGEPSLLGNARFQATSPQVLPIGLQQHGEQQSVLVNEIVNQLMDVHHIQEHLNPMISMISQMCEEQLQVVRDFIHREQVKRVQELHVAAFNGYAVPQRMQVPLNGEGSDEYLGAALYPHVPLKHTPNMQPQSMPMMFVDQMVQAQTAQTFASATPLQSTTTSVHHNTHTLHTDPGAAHFGNNLNSYVANRKTFDSCDRPTVGRLGEEQEEQRVKSTSPPPQFPSNEQCSGRIDDERAMLKNPPTQTTISSFVPNNQFSACNSDTLTSLAESQVDNSQQCTFSSRTTTQSCQAVDDTSNCSDASITSTVNVERVKDSASSPSGLNTSLQLSSSSHHLSKQRHRHSAVEADDIDPATSMRHKMKFERTRIHRYVANNFFTFLVNKKAQRPTEESNASTDLNNCTTSQRSPKQEADDNEEVPLVITRARKTFIEVDEAEYEQKLANELKEKLLEEQEARKTYPELDYPPVPEISMEEAERRLMALLLIHVKDFEQCSPSPLEYETDHATLASPSVSCSATSRPRQLSQLNVSRKEKLVYKLVERRIPHVPDVGRQTTSRLRALFRADIDCSSPLSMLTQRRRLELRHTADQQRMDDLNRKKFKWKKTPLSAPVGRRGGPRNCKKMSIPTSPSDIPRTPVLHSSVSKCRRIAHTMSQEEDDVCPRSPVKHKLSAPDDFSCSLRDTSSLLASMRQLCKSQVQYVLQQPEADPQPPTTSSFLREAPGAEFMLRPAILTQNNQGFGQGVCMSQTSTVSSTPSYTFPFDDSFFSKSRGSNGELEKSVEKKVKRKYTKRKHTDSSQTDDNDDNFKPKVAKKRGPKPHSLKKTKKQMAEDQKQLEIELGIVDEEELDVDTNFSHNEPSIQQYQEEPCAHQVCRLTEVVREAEVRPVEWVQCDVCDLWFHCLCALKANRPVGKREVFRCCQPHCQSSNPALTVLSAQTTRVGRPPKQK